MDNSRAFQLAAKPIAVVIWDGRPKFHLVCDYEILQLIV